MRALCAQGLPEDIVARLPEWQFTGQQVSIWPHYRDIANPTDHPTALAHTLTQVAPLKAPGSELRLCGWCWQLDTARAAAAALLAAPELRVTVVIETLTDEALGAVLILGTQVRAYVLCAPPPPATHTHTHTGNTHTQHRQRYITVYNVGTHVPTDIRGTHKHT